MLNRNHSTVCSYGTGRLAVPADVAEKLRALCRDKIDAMQASGIVDKNLAAVRAEKYARLVAQSQKAAELARMRTNTLAMRRSRAIPRQYPAYRMTHEKVRLLIEAYKRYLGFIRGQWQVCADEHRLHDLKLELADITRLAQQAVEIIRAPPPYDYYITSMEWYVVSRALRHLDTSHGVVQARSLYQHWRKYKGMHFQGYGKYAYRGAQSALLPAAKSHSSVTEDKHVIEPRIEKIFAGSGE